MAAGAGPNQIEMQASRHRQMHWDLFVLLDIFTPNKTGNLRIDRV